MDERIVRAEAARARNVADVKPRWRMAFHVVAPSGWLNDPNGLCWFAGQYHAFYQHHPFSTDWGPMHWGHAVSADLVHWRDVGIALAPGDECDVDGCFSGSAVDDDGQLTLVYTGHHYVDPDPATRNMDHFTEDQNIAVSRDGITFIKDPGNPVIAAAPPDSTHHFRDPKVWQHAGSWYMVLGNQSRAGSGRAILYRSADLRTWEYLGVVAESDGSTGFMWECPDLFTLDGRDVLLISPMGMGEPRPDGLPVHHTGSLVGTFDYSTHTLSHGPYAEMDHGHDFYAVQTLLAPDGRRIAIGWMKAREDGPSEKSDGWAGALSLPRELHVTADGCLTQQPVAEVEGLRGRRLLSLDREVLGRLDTGVVVGVAEVVLDADLSGSGADRVGFRLASGEDGVDVTFDRRTGSLELDRGGVDGVRRAPFDAGTHLRLRAFVDRSSVEVFTGSGRATMTSRFYPSAPPRLQVVSTGGPTPFTVSAHALGDIWKDSGVATS